MSSRLALLSLKKKRKIPEKDAIKNWKIVRGDEVFVNSGKDKGKIAKVLKVERSKNRVFVKGCNMVKKTVKSSEQFKGGIFSKESPIHYSKLNLIDPQTRKPTRISFIRKDRKEVRISDKTGLEIPKPIHPYVLWRQKNVGKMEEGPKDTQPDSTVKQTYFPSLESVD